MTPYAMSALGARPLVAAVALLLFLAVGFQVAVYGALASPGASAPAPARIGGGADSPSTSENVAALGAGLPLPVVPGDARWGVGADTYCETFVEQELGLGNQGDTAFGAYLRLAAQGLVQPGPPPEPGDLVYFAPAAANGFDGHVGIARGVGLFTSVTDAGVHTEPLAGWDAPYLGWVRPTDIRTDRFGRSVSPR